VQRRIGSHLPFLSGFLLRLPPFFLLSQNRVFEVISESGAEGGIVRGGEGRALKRLAPQRVLPALDVQQSAFHGEQKAIALQVLGGQTPQWPAPVHWQADRL